MSFKLVIFHVSALEHVEQRDNCFVIYPLESEKFFLYWNPNRRDLGVRIIAGPDAAIEDMVRETLSETLVENKSVFPRDTLYIDMVPSRIDAVERIGVAVCQIVPLGMPIITTGKRTSQRWQAYHPMEVRLIVEAQQQAY